MAGEKRLRTPPLPIPRQLSHVSSENTSREPAKPTQNTSMRNDTNATKSASVRTVTSGGTKGSTTDVELESQSSLQKPYDTRAANSRPKPSKGGRSWMAKLHPCPQTIEDSVMGTSDGMTVPFALTASLAGIAPNARYIMLAGLAELTAGAISMALGGALQARCEKETYDSTVKNAEHAIRNTKHYVPTVVDDLFHQWNFSPETLAHISYDLSNNSIEAQTNFVVRFHHELSIPDNSRVLKSSATLGSTYFMAGFLGLFPYMIVHRHEIKPALYASIAIEAVALYIFGWLKTGVSIGWTGRENVRKAFVGAVTMVLVGTIAAGIAVGLITVVDKSEHISG